MDESPKSGTRNMAAMTNRFEVVIDIHIKFFYNIKPLIVDGFCIKNLYEALLLTICYK